MKQKAWNNTDASGGSNGPLISETIPNGRSRRTHLVHFDIDPQNSAPPALPIVDTGYWILTDCGFGVVLVGEMNRGQPLDRHGHQDMHTFAPVFKISDIGDAKRMSSTLPIYHDP